MNQLSQKLYTPPSEESKQNGGFLLYINDQLEQLKEEYLDKSAAERLLLLSKKWRDLKEETKQDYIQKHLDNHQAKWQQLVSEFKGAQKEVKRKPKKQLEQFEESDEDSETAGNEIKKYDVVRAKEIASIQDKIDWDLKMSAEEQQKYLDMFEAKQKCQPVSPKQEEEHLCLIIPKKLSLKLFIKTYEERVLKKKQ